MAQKTTLYAQNLLKLLFNNVAFANFGDAGGLQPSASAGNLYLSFHSADPGIGGDQTTLELSYTGYARLPVPRDVGHWTVSGEQVTNAALMSWPQCTALTGTAAYVGIGTASGGAGQLLYRLLVTSPPGGLAISAGITPQIQISQLLLLET